MADAKGSWISRKSGIYWLISMVFIGLVLIVLVRLSGRPIGARESENSSQSTVASTDVIQPMLPSAAAPQSASQSTKTSPTVMQPVPEPALATSALQSGEVAIIPSNLKNNTGLPKPIVAIGVMGDSNSDEYRGDDNRGGPRYGPTTLNWVEQLALRRDLNFGPWGEWGGLRRTGFKYNWALSGATVRTLVARGQHTGLAQQVASGEVSHVILYIGGADFHLERGTYAEIYDGSLSDAAVQSKIDMIIANITVVVDTIFDAGDVQMVVVNFLDKGTSPEAIQRFPKVAGRNRVSEAINVTNNRLNMLAEEKGFVVADINAYGTTLLPRVVDNRYLNVGGELISVVNRGNEPHHLQLNDRSGHMGMVFSGLLVNAILVEFFNNAFGYDIEPLTDEEILENAGLR